MRKMTRSKNMRRRNKKKNEVEREERVEKLHLSHSGSGVLKSNVLRCGGKGDGARKEGVKEGRK